VSRPSDHRVVVVGAGIGGLVSTVLLAARGLDVTLVDASPAPGGKMRQVRIDGVGIDSGPTVFTMRWVLDAVFAAAGTRLEDHLHIAPLEVLARHAWRGRSGDGSDSPRLDLHADLARSIEAISVFAGAAEGRRFAAFCAEARRLYATLEGPYIRSPRPDFLRLVRDLGPGGVLTLASLGPMASLAGRLARHFRDPRLQQLFGRYATYTGSAPGLAPATLMLITQVELDGVWRVQGGMHAVAQALMQLAQRLGARVRLGTRVAGIVVSGGRASGVRLADGESLAADSVVYNGDVNALAQGVLGAAATPAAAPVARADRSLSAMTWSMHAASRGFPLTMHNVFFDDDYASEFDDIFTRGRLPRRGTVYVCAQDRDDAASLSSPLGDGRERLLALVNAPPLGDGPSAPDSALSEEELQRCEQRSFDLLRACGLTIHRTTHNTVRTAPQDFERLFPATGGALYGRASHGWMAQFKRPGSLSRLPGLWMVGGSVHPGPGVPMAAMSGRLAAEALMAHLGSTSRWHPAPTSGGTSTRSATTASTPSPSSPSSAASSRRTTAWPDAAGG
jgi:1-hydroxycarotenoid 3,4-desaturase